jgi:hypothetical protein
VDEAQQCDGIQLFNNGEGDQAAVEHSYIARTLSTQLGTPLNSAITFGTAANDGTPNAVVMANNNYFESGVYHLRANYCLTGTVITNNDFGPLFSGEAGLVDVAVPASLATWSGNRDSTGSTIATPYTPAVPTIKEVLQTTNGLTGAQTLNTTAGLTATNDTLVVAYFTDNNTFTPPTSTAGTLVQLGTTAANGDGNTSLAVYTVQCQSAGSKGVTMPAAGGFDVMGLVLLVSGAVYADGLATAAPAVSNTTFSTPAATLASSKDLLVSVLANGQGRTFDLTSSGLMQQANPQCLPFAALTVGTAALNAAGTSPTYTVTTSGAAKPTMVTFGLKG